MMGSAQAAAGLVAGEVSTQERVAFIRRTYLHLWAAIGAFVLLEVALFQTGVARAVADFAFRSNWLLFLGGFMLVGFLANRFAHSPKAGLAQYAGLGLYVVAQAFMFVPLLYMAVHYSSRTVLPAAVLTTLVAFSGITVTVFLTRADFSFMRIGLALLGFVALGLVVAGALFGFDLGLWFSAGMALFAAAYVLYDTSNVLHHYRTDQHVAASLALFSSVALMFWYVLRLFMRKD